MKIINLEEVESTHTYLQNFIKEKGYTYPICVMANSQTKGIASRGNSWIGKKGNLFFSFVLKKDKLPEDLKLQSASVYFSFILRSILKSQGSSLWLKWPNDFYLGNKKIGGTITTLSKDLIYCGIGLNLLEVDQEYGKLDIQIDKKVILDIYFKSLKNKLLWREIFSSFKIEFQKSKNLETTINNKKILLDNAVLNSDGSIQLLNKKVYSLR